jgi:hypothetical protein
MAAMRRLWQFPPMTEELSLAGEFPPTTEEDWRRLVEAALKGASFDKKLVSQTYDGLRIEPLYPRAAGAAVVAGREPGTAWQVVVRVDHPHAKAANAEALHELENGATGLALLFSGALAAREFGAAVNTVNDLEQTLSGVMLDLITLRLETAPFAGRPIATLMTELAGRRKFDAAAWRARDAPCCRGPSCRNEPARRRRTCKAMALQRVASCEPTAARRMRRAGRRPRNLPLSSQTVSLTCVCSKRPVSHSTKRGNAFRS